VLRHTFGTEAVERYGMHLEKVKGLMRHKHVKTTATYIAALCRHYFPADTMRDLIAAREATQQAAEQAPDIGPVRRSAGFSEAASRRGTSAGSCITSGPQSEPRRTKENA